MKRVMLVAGEASGDLHAAKLAAGVLAKRSDIKFFGIGGTEMRKAGVDVLIDSAELAVVGLFEVLAHRKVIFGALNKMRELLRSEPPDLLILTDYPDFNLRLAQTAKQLGIKVLYYISPQVWAWRESRVKTIRERVDMMAVVFPFEEEFYQKYQVPVRYVGHPLSEEVSASAGRDTLLQEFGLDPTSKTVGLFPGSRQSEIRRLLPIILEAATQLKQRNPELQFLLPIASTLSAEDIKTYLVNYQELAITMVSERSYDVMEACDAIITVSGTVTLEIALLGKPMVIINRLAWLSYHIVKRMFKLDYIGLCNIVANERLVPELIQQDAQPGKIVTEIEKMLYDEQYRKSICEKLSRVQSILAQPPQEGDIVDLTLEMLEEINTAQADKST
ncbi:MAG: lipid-A-disaccharide synthase [Gammaproteobacteria bacterium]|nr:lipid-A-disaccharide synthase [Gammaproteobacteria bacterium]